MTESLEKPIVVQQGKTKSYSAHFQSYAFLKDPSMIQMEEDGDSRMYLCISFDAIDHTGHPANPKIIYAGEFYLEDSGNEGLVHWTEASNMSIVLVS